MPAVLATLARQLIIMAVQTAIFVVIEKMLNKVIDKIRTHHAEVNGLDPDDAENQTANDIIDIALLAGVTLVMLRTKLPVRVAEKLGFTSRGFVKRPLSAAGAAKMAAKGAKPIVTNATSAEVASEAAQIIAKTRGSTWSVVNNIFNVTLKVLAIPVGVGLLVTNTIDFGAWPSSAYQTSVQKFLAWFGLKPDAEAKSSKVLSQAVWDKIYATYQNLGATGINNPYSNMSQPFTRDNLIALVDKTASQIIAQGGKATFQSVFGATQGFLVMSEPVTLNKINSVFPNTAGAKTGGSTNITVPTITKVFTGIVSQGVVGSGLVFEARPDDMIESAEELRQAAANNLAPYLNSLLGKIVYEVKVVSSIITKEGFKQSGTTQKIITGYDTSGNPKYKTVTNKFATLVVYALTDKGSRAKLTTIVLGPTDSAKLTIAQDDLRSLETELPGLVTTTDINEIDAIKTDTGLIVEQNENTNGQGNNNNNKNYYIIVKEKDANYQVGPFYNDTAVNNVFTQIDEDHRSAHLAYKGMSIVEYNPNLPIWNGIGNDNEIISVPAADTVPDDSTPLPPVQKPGANATTLFEWYQAQGQTLPSVNARSFIYESFGLGPRSYYTGTAEQNTRLLNALKSS